MAVDRPGEQASLHNAELRLVLLLEDLERTVQTAEQLANSGHEDEALRIIDLQLAALDELPAQLAREISPPRPGRSLRRLALTTVAACLTIAASVATAVITGPQPIASEDVTSFLDRADLASDPENRLNGLEAALSAFSDLKANDPSRRQLGARLASEARKAEEEMRAEDADPQLVTRASALAERAERSAPTPPSSAHSPLEGLLPQP